MDLFAQELQKADFDTDEACMLMFGGKKSYEIAKRICDSLYNDPIVQNQPYRTDMDRGELFSYQLKKLQRVINLSREGKVPKVDWLSYTIYTYPIGGLVATSAHHGMFESFIRNLGSEEQVKKYLDDILNYKIFG